MQTTNRVFDEIARLGMGFLKTALFLKTEVKERFKDTTPAYVSREEFEVMREMVQKTRIEMDHLKEKLSDQAKN